MKFTTVAADAFQKFQLNAGIILTEFDPTNPVVDRSKIFMATSGGAAFSVTPEYVDLAEDVDNVPANTKQMKVLQSVTAVMSGTGKTVDTLVCKRLMAAADVRAGGRIVPRADLKQSDFTDLWWVGDYSDANVDVDGTTATAGFMAINLKNALSTGGFSLQPNDKGKGDFSFEFTGHYNIDNMTELPYEVWLKAGTSDDSDDDADATLTALAISSLSTAITPTFDANTLRYTAVASGSSSTVTATKSDSDAGVVVTVNGDSIANGGTATWVDGANVVKVIVTNGSAENTYTVIVTADVE